MRALIIVCTLLVSTFSWGATAYFTARQESETTVTGQIAWRCEYDYFGQKFWRVFKNTCPMSIETY